MKYAVLTGRILFSLIFIMPAFGHFKPETIAFAAAHGVPMANILVPLSTFIMLAGALSVALGYKAKIGGWLLIAFLLPVTFTMHSFWKLTDPMAQQMDLVMFMKNMALVGASLMIAYFGAGPVSLDNRVRSRGKLGLA